MALLDERLTPDFGSCHGQGCEIEPHVGFHFSACPSPLAPMHSLSLSKINQAINLF